MALSKNRNKQLEKLISIFSNPDSSITPRAVGELLITYAARETDNRINKALSQKLLEKFVTVSERLRESENTYRSIIAAMREGVVVQNRKGEIIASNKNAEKILGVTAAQLEGKTSLDPAWRSVHEDGTPFPGDGHPAMVTLTTGKPQNGIIMGVHKTDSSLTWISINSQPIFSRDESVPHAVVTTFSDITERKIWEEEIKKISVTDHLTQIYNRVQGNRSLETEIERASRYNEKLSLIMFDIDHFKSVNDTYGHDAGDQVLVTVSREVDEQLRPTDEFIRWGGEEFLVILPHTEKEQALQLAERIRKHIEALRFPSLPGITCSFGVSAYAREDTVDTFTKRVDEALYQAKREGRNRSILL